MWPILAACVTGLFSVLLVTQEKDSRLQLSPLTSPLNFKSVLRLALFIGGILIIVAIAMRWFSTEGEGVRIVAFLSGLFELHAVSLATAILYVGEKIDLANAQLTLLLAVLASFLSKLVIIGYLSRDRFAILTSLFLIAMVLVGTAVFWIMPA